MFNSELVVIDPANLVPIVLLTCAMTAVGRMHERFSLVERIISSPCHCLFNILCGKDGHQGKSQKKIQDLTVGKWKNTHGLESILMLSSKF